MAEPLVEAVGVARTFAGPPPVTALREANLHVHGGELVAIVGPSGSGKSTLLNLLGLLDTPTAGELRLAGRAVHGLPERTRTALRARRIGFVFQAFHLVAHLDCVQNVMLPMVHSGQSRTGRRARAVAALESVGLGHRTAARPATLSGGERQRVAIARAMVHEPVLLLCDEPTGNLDQNATLAILALLRETVGPQRAVVVVTHEQAVREVADRTLEVRDGRVG
ncbi:ABC transporter ATP-binding protein [Dactylosporangium sp. McL0621]|uniref:ABC transporter ATP-binding protein n=1 Tax=Dactylosporangium sp. McL0621 TaxID=3415678 RepID=UPI003CE875E6